MSKKQIIPLVVICAVLIGLLVAKKLSEKPLELKDQMTLEMMAPSGFLSADVTKIALYGGGKKEDAITLIKKDDAWTVQTTFNAPGKGDKIGEFLEKIKKLQGEFRSDKAEALPSYDLTDGKSVHIEIYRGEDQQASYHLLVGKKAGSNRSFVRRGGDNTVYIVDLNIASELGMWSDDKKAPESSQWIDTAVLDLDKNVITRLALKTPDRSIVLEKKEKPAPPKKEGDADKKEPEKEPKKEYEWVVSGGAAGLKLKRSGVDTILGVLDSFKATEVADPATKKDLGLDEPAYRCDIALETGDPVVVTAAKGGPDASGYVMTQGRDVIFKVANYQFDKLFIEGKKLFDLPAIGAKDEDVTNIRLDYGSGHVQLERDKENAQWKVTQPITGLEFKEAEAGKVAAALATWEAMDYADGSDLGRFELTAPERRVVFRMADGTSHTLAVGVESKQVKARYSILDGGKQALLTGKDESEKIFPKPRTFWEMDIARIQSDDILKITVKRDDLSYVLTRKGKEKWELATGNVKIEPESKDVKRYLDRFSPFRASGVVLQQKAFPTTVWARVDVEAKKGAKLGISFAAEKEGDCETQVDGRPAILLVGKYTAENATPALKDFFNLTVFDISRDDMKKISVKRPGEPLEASKDGDAWTIAASGKPVAADKEKLKKYVGRFSYLRADDLTVGEDALLKGAPRAVVTITKKDDSAVTVTFGKEKNGMVALRRGDDPQIYLLKKVEADRLLPASKDLLADVKKEPKP